MTTNIYFDYAATSPADERVVTAMFPYFTQKFGNPSSRTHSFGWTGAQAVKTAREQLAEMLGCETQELIFTSGATESINLALKGVFEIYAPKGKHIITSQTEHRAVLGTCKALEQKGARVTYLAVDRNGLIDLEVLKNSINDQTILVCLQFANNETGVLQPVKEIAEIVHERNSIFMSDAAQAVGKIPVNVAETRIDLLCLSGHKFCGPKGAGALYVRRKNPRVKLQALIDGGGQEEGLRSGTLNVPAIVGLGKAAEIAAAEMSRESERVSLLRGRLERALTVNSGVQLNGSVNLRLPGISNLLFSGFTAAELISKLPGLAFSAGSACASASGEPSHVLTAMGLNTDQARRSLRLSLGRFTTEAEIDEAVKRILALANKHI